MPGKTCSLENDMTYLNNFRVDSVSAEDSGRFLFNGRPSIWTSASVPDCILLWMLQPPSGKLNFSPSVSTKLLTAIRPDEKASPQGAVIERRVFTVHYRSSTALQRGTFTAACVFIFLAVWTTRILPAGALNKSPGQLLMLFPQYNWCSMSRHLSGKRL